MRLGRFFTLRGTLCYPVAVSKAVQPMYVGLAKRNPTRDGNAASGYAFG